VEILKFAEPPKRSSRTSAQKRGGLMPLLAVVVSVAVVGGMSTTLAGTISLNSSGSVEFGQGVVTTAACDASIKILPASSFDSETSEFSVSSIELQDIGIRSNGNDTDTVGGGCLSKRLTLKAYDVDGEPLEMFATGGATFVYIEIPDSGTAPTLSPNGSPNDKTQYTDVSAGVSIPEAGGFGGTTTDTGEASAGYVVIGGLQIPGTVTRITLESSEPQ
jgi:hypothetical protein